MFHIKQYTRNITYTFPFANTKSFYLARNYERFNAIQVTQNPPLMGLRIIGVCDAGPEIKNSG
jgi:hypothetical protein